MEHLCYAIGIMERKSGLSDIGAALRQAREAAGKRQEEVAELVGVPRSTLGRIEAGKVTPTWGLVLAFSEALGLQPVLVPHGKARSVEAILSVPTTLDAPPLLGDEW